MTIIYFNNLKKVKKMAITTSCAQLLKGQDGACIAPKRRYYQQAVVINKTDITNVDITRPDYVNGACNYSVTFNLKEGKKGFLFKGHETGSSYFGTFDKTTSALGFPQYKHNVNLNIVDASVESKCILDSLDKGLFAVALQFTDGTVEIYGIGNGLKTADYTYDLQGGGGGGAIILSSAENGEENYLPLVYKSKTDGAGNADFDSLFENKTDSKKGGGLRG